MKKILSLFIFLCTFLSHSMEESEHGKSENGKEEILAEPDDATHYTKKIGNGLRLTIPRKVKDGALGLINMVKNQTAETILHNQLKALSLQTFKKFKTEEDLEVTQGTAGNLFSLLRSARIPSYTNLQHARLLMRHIQQNPQSLEELGLLQEADKLGLGLTFMRKHLPTLEIGSCAGKLDRTIQKGELSGLDLPTLYALCESRYISDGKETPEKGKYLAESGEPKKEPTLLLQALRKLEDFTGDPKKTLLIERSDDILAFMIEATGPTTLGITSTTLNLPWWLGGRPAKNVVKWAAGKRATEEDLEYLRENPKQGQALAFFAQGVEQLIEAGEFTYDDLEEKKEFCAEHKKEALSFLETNRPLLQKFIRNLEEEKQNPLQALSKFLDPESFSAIEKQILQEDSSEKERKSFSTTQTTVHDLQQLQAWVKKQKDVTAEYETRTLDFFRELGQKGSDAMLRNSP